MKAITFFRSLLVLGLTVSLFSCSSNEDAQEVVSNQPIITLKNYTQSAFEIELLDLVNQDRVSKGLNALTLINEISYVSSTHNDYMIANGTPSHNNFELRSATLKSALGAISVSENVAAGYNTPQATLAAWNASATHKANLEGTHSHFGLSVKADANGKKYYTLLFIRK